ncbi:hypothetical protein EBO15_19480 [Actinomadura harenae]|uniref:Uncharacterized protein n=1 Tax=Actinomadura harenae TaxID=2483351 RepID=A0A3M2M0M9_9ACTN|nr:hypothetical protein EBO15_19480 [Actinomadura harenae]
MVSDAHPRQPMQDAPSELPVGGTTSRQAESIVMALYRQCYDLSCAATRTANSPPTSVGRGGCG